MINSILPSIFAGALAGLIHGFLFTKRLAGFLRPSSSSQNNRSTLQRLGRIASTILSFFVGYGFIGIIFFMLKPFNTVNLVCCLVTFLTLFWLNIWRYTTKKS